MKRPILKAPPPASARYKCAFPGCEKRYVSTDGVRKHARKRHTEWLRNVDEHSSFRDKAYESKPSTYCIMECDEDDEEGSDFGSSWRSEDHGASDNEAPEEEEHEVVTKPTPVAAEPTRLAAITLQMNAEALMPTRLPSVPDFVSLLAQAPIVTMASPDDEPSTPPYSPTRTQTYETPYQEGKKGMEAPHLPFFLLDDPTPEPTKPVPDDYVTEPEGLDPAECDAFVSTLLASF
jgi:hypothetical protein